jgi:hypothetical protein
MLTAGAPEGVLPTVPPRRKNITESRLEERAAPPSPTAIHRVIMVGRDALR